MPNCRITTDLIFEMFDVSLEQWFPVYIKGLNQPKLCLGDEPDLTGVPLKINPNNFTTVGAKNYRVSGGYFQILNVDTNMWHTIWVEADEESGNSNPKISISQIGQK